MADKDKSQENKEKTKESKKEDKYVKSVWRHVSIGFVVLTVILVAVILSGCPSGNVTGAVTADAAAERVTTFIKENLVAEGTEVTVNEINEENSLYRLSIEVTSGGMSQEVESYITKDGVLFFPQAIDLNEVEELLEQQGEESQTQEEDITKSEKPEVHAFVMSYCPYGLQFMKAYIPVMELLGEKADIELNFVSYAMHGKDEIDENLRMYCIQKEQKDKFTDYLRCFVETDDYEECLSAAGVDTDMLDSCIQTTDEEFKITELYEDKSTWSGGSFPMFPVEDDLNKKYGVRGSPTFVVNHKVISVTRSAEAIKDSVCSAFITPPPECEEELSNEAEQPGIGPIGSGSGSTSGGSCG
ncbi:MAG: hypothetical protein JSV92_03145 [archaeon]|nr:MAG: hypothetical protein JSV92_03145 [archaeon]